MSYSSEVLADRPAAYWRLGEATGLPQDSSGHAQHATVTTGSPVYSQLGAIRDVDTAISLTGTQAFSVPDNNTLDLGDVFTLEAWIKRNTLNAAQNAIVSKETGGYYMRISSNDKLSLLASGVALIVDSTVAILDTAYYHHVVATKNGATVNLYIDAMDRTGTVTNATCVDNALAFLIGADTTLVDKPDMTLDEIAVYPTVLSPARILAHFNAAAVGGGGPPGGGTPETPPPLWNRPPVPTFPGASPPPMWNKASD